MVWWIAAKALAPLASGVLGAILKFVLLVALVGVGMLMVGLDPITIVVDLVTGVVDAVLDWIVSALENRVSV